MAPVSISPLGEVLHDLLTARTARERNKELALALVAAVNRGEDNSLTRGWTIPAGPGRRALPAGLRLTVRSLLADGDVVVLRATARAGQDAWSLVTEFRFDTAGRIASHHDMLVPEPTAT